jgi:hypothetical protein
MRLTPHASGGPAVVYRSVWGLGPGLNETGLGRSMSAMARRVNGEAFLNRADAR